MDIANKIEKEASPPAIWFKFRKRKMNASMNNGLKMEYPKTERGRLPAALGF